MNASSSADPTQIAFSGPLDLLQGAPGTLLQKAYLPANTSPAINAETRVEPRFGADVARADKAG